MEKRNKITGTLKDIVLGEFYIIIVHSYSVAKNVELLYKSSIARPCYSY